MRVKDTVKRWYTSFCGDLTPHANTVKPCVYRAQGHQQYITTLGGNREAVFIEHLNWFPCHPFKRETKLCKGDEGETERNSGS